MSSYFTIRTGQHYRLRAITLPQNCLVVVVSGEKRLHIPQGVQSIHAGDALVIARGTYMDVENIPPKQHSYVARMLSFSEASISRFAHSDLGTPQRRNTPDFQKIKLSTPLIDCFDHACKALEQCELYSEKLQEHRVQEVLLALSGIGVVFTPNVQLSWVERVHRLVAQHPANQWNSERVAQAFHLSPATLQRRLASENNSLASCVREARMEVAMGLLQSTETPVYDIAQTCGYRSVSKFSAVFRQRFGTLPSKLR
jgi:AraC-like DNA-binding protein